MDSFEKSKYQYLFNLCRHLCQREKIAHDKDEKHL